MKHRLLFPIFLVLLLAAFFGCKQESLLTSPESPEISSNEPNWIKLPKPAEETLMKDYSDAEWINGDYGGELKVGTFYSYWFGWWKNQVTVTASLVFERGAFDGTRYIEMSINDQCGVGTFSPAGSFDKPAVYNLSITGIDLSGINPKDVKFVYLAPDGTYQEVENDGIFVNVQYGRLSIKNARLPHFSRYGFIT